MKLTHIAFFAFASLGSVFGQGIQIPTPPVKTPVTLIEHIETLPTTGFQANTAVVVPLKATPTVGTLVTVYLDTFTPFVTKTVVKTTDNLTLSLSPEQLAAGGNVVVIYKSDK